MVLHLRVWPEMQLYTYVGKSFEGKASEGSPKLVYYCPTC